MNRDLNRRRRYLAGGEFGDERGNALSVNVKLQCGRVGIIGLQIPAARPAIYYSVQRPIVDRRFVGRPLNILEHWNHLINIQANRVPCVQIDISRIVVRRKPRNVAFE